MSRLSSRAPDAGAAFSPADLLFVHPSAEFRKLAARPRFVVPIAAQAVGTLLLALWFYGRLDINWFRQYLVATNPLVAHYGLAGGFPFTREMLRWPASLSAAFATLYGWLAMSLYLACAARALRRDLGVRQALALVAWAELPFVLMLLPSAINVALHPDGRLAPDQLDPTTLALMFGTPDGAFVQSLLSRLGLASFWSWSLLAIGVRTLMAVRLSTAVALVVVPMVLVYGSLGAIAALAG